MSAAMLSRCRFGFQCYIENSLRQVPRPVSVAHIRHARTKAGSRVPASLIENTDPLDAVAASSASGSSSSVPSSSSDYSIFSSNTSAWDHVFDNIKEAPSLMPAAVRNNRPDGNQSRGRARQTMTARERSAFDDMFNMLFDAVSEQSKLTPNAGTFDGGDGSVPGIGSVQGGKSMSDLFGKLRRHSRNSRMTDEWQEELDRKKEEMDLCDTDHQLLDWAMREVFDESKRYEERARKAIQEAAAQPKSKSLSALAKEAPMLQPPAYSYLVAHLMRLFRERYKDPHLALSMFEHARLLSIASYVFGCSTPAYNELLLTRWTCFRDLRGVHDALQEMSVNGVEPDSMTRKFVDQVRREAGEKSVWEDNDDIGAAEVRTMLHNMDKLMLVSPATTRRSRAVKKGGLKPNESWKSAGLREEEYEKSDSWTFGQFKKPRRGKKRGGPLSHGISSRNRDELDDGLAV